MVRLKQVYSQIAVESEPQYVDRWLALEGRNGAIRSDLTTDNLHLSSAVYKAWTDVLNPYRSDIAK